MRNFEIDEVMLDEYKRFMSMTKEEQELDAMYNEAEEVFNLEDYRKAKYEEAKEKYEKALANYEEARARYEELGIEKDYSYLSK